MRKLLAVALFTAVAAALPAEAGQGRGRVSVLPGWRFGLNNRFYQRAAEDGYVRAPSWGGGPVLLTGFAYSATDLFELSIDPFVAYEPLRLVDVPPITAWIYGAVVTLRMQVEPAFLGGAVTLGAGLSTGGLLVNVSGGDAPSVESFAPAYGATATVAVKLSESYGVAFEYKVLFAEGAGTAFGEARGNGHILSVGFTWYFAEGPSSHPFN